MRLRKHDDGRVALQTPAGDWIGMDSPHQATWPEPGWRELVVLDPDADARRLCDAIQGCRFRPGIEHDMDLARAVLERLAAGTEGER